MDPYKPPGDGLNLTGGVVMAGEATIDRGELRDRLMDLARDLEKHAAKIRNQNDIYQEHLSPLTRLAVFVTERVGTMGFFFMVLAWTVFWLSWNALAPQSLRFDPPTAFVLWLIISNILQILLMPLLLVGQNIQGMRADIRGQHDYETDQRAEKEIKAMLLHFESQNKTMEKILASLETLLGTERQTGQHRG
jgi:uncharacterized membrane protein